MSFYPILTAPGCAGRTTLYNYAPNNWECKDQRSSFVNASWTDGDLWRTEIVDNLIYGASKEYSRSDLPEYVPNDALVLLSLTSEPLLASSRTLPQSTNKTNVPSWRATLGLKTPFSFASYQGELDPFPAPGSLLTFAPLLQFSDSIVNYLLFINLESSPKIRPCTIKVFKADQPSECLGLLEVKSNSISHLQLDHLGLGAHDLPVFASQEISGVPLFLSKTLDAEFISIEHTHPPASTVIHGNRVLVQKMLKRVWFAKLDI